MAFKCGMYFMLKKTYEVKKLENIYLKNKVFIRFYVKSIYV